MQTYEEAVLRQLTDKEKQKLIALIEAGEPLPEKWRGLLFSGGGEEQVGKEYRLVYAGKQRREEVLAQTPAAPWQLERSYCTERPHGDGWRNMLVWGDNLLALRELLADQQGPNHYGTRGKIKLVYIDPPFATRQDFMKDKEKAYRDKVYGAQFIEFLRKRLILLKELLAEDGSIYVHLDSKKGHYIKAVMDEVFGEHNFRNEIIWQRTNSHNEAGVFGRVHDTLFFYTKGDSYLWNPPRIRFTDAQLKRYKVDSKGRLFTCQDLTAERRNSNSGKFEWRGTMPSSTRGWGYKLEQLERWWAEGRIATRKDGSPRMDGLIVYLDDMPGQSPQSIWFDIPRVGNTSKERIDYPTQKPEVLIERIIRSSSRPGDIVLDCFAGSGTTPAVAEKLDRRWIAMDSGKLAIYTTQKRLFSLTDSIGAARKDDRAEPERIEDWGAHLKSTPGVLLITEKARRGECEITEGLLADLAALVNEHGLLKKGAELSLACPEAKLKIPDNALEECGEVPGSKRVVIDGVAFRISLIMAKDKQSKPKALPAKEFALIRAGVYDMDAISALPWEDYRPFVLKLFGVRDQPHTRYGLTMDGYLGTYSALLWNYPDYKDLTLDYGYVDDLHRALRGKKGERFYVIAPVVAMAFAEDEVVRDGTTYVFLKVPLSVLLRLIEAQAPAALKQPTSETDVNEVIDAVGFDFISQPQVKVRTKKNKRKGELLSDFVIELEEFRSQTLTTDPEDYSNFETFSMAMADLDYDGKVFCLDQVYWAEDLIKAVGGLDEAKSLQIRIPESEFAGERLMLVLCDRYGNEKTLVFERKSFK